MMRSYFCHRSSRPCRKNNVTIDQPTSRNDDSSSRGFALQHPRQKLIFSATRRITTKNLSRRSWIVRGLLLSATIIVLFHILHLVQLSTGSNEEEYFDYMLQLRHATSMTTTTSVRSSSNHRKILKSSAEETLALVPVSNHLQRTSTDHNISSLAVDRAIGNTANSTINESNNRTPRLTDEDKDKDKNNSNQFSSHITTTTTAFNISIENDKTKGAEREVKADSIQSTNKTGIHENSTQFVYTAGQNVSNLNNNKNTNNKEKNTENRETTDIMSSVPLCTFEVLQRSFGVAASNNTSAASSSSSSSSCWSLQERVLRVHVDHVLNRDIMPTIGGGNSGRVYKAIIQLKTSTTHQLKQGSGIYSPSACVAALKTDFCLHKKTREVYPCVHTELREGGSVRIRKKQSFLKGEYAGALAWYAQLETNNLQKGLLPTWGLVYTNQRAKKQNRKSPTQSTSKTLGVLMPLQKMTTTLEARLHEQGERKLKPKQVAELMLPAVKGLAFLSAMGLVHQDVHLKNIGIVPFLDDSTSTAAESALVHTGDKNTNTNNNTITTDASPKEYAILFDNSYLSVLPDESKEKPVNCSNSEFVVNRGNNNNKSATVFASVACSFCPEPDNFPHPSREDYWRTEETLSPLGLLESDALRMRNFVLRFLDNGGSPEGRSMSESLLNCSSAPELANLLEAVLLRPDDDIKE